jgi:metallophosphoesterase (TIGR00282 family)
MSILKKKKIKILFLGDIMGKAGRKGIVQELARIKKELKPDLVIANAENLAHGKGVTEKTLIQMQEAGVDAFTSGNHITKRPTYEEILDNKKFNIIRPANYPEGMPGKEFLKLKVGSSNIYLINLLGRVFFEENLDCPFHKLDEFLEKIKPKKNDIILVDLHAEATSEKVAFGWYADGKISFIAGTHTHVPTADEKIMPGGTGYITDLGMVGPSNSVIGVKKEIIINNFLTQVHEAHQLPEDGEVEINGILAEIDTKTGKCVKIKRVREFTTVK